MECKKKLLRGIVVRNCTIKFRCSHLKRIDSLCTIQESSNQAKEAAIITDLKERLTKSETATATILEKIEQIGLMVSPAKASDLSKSVVEEVIRTENDKKQVQVEIIESNGECFISSANDL